MRIQKKTRFFSLGRKWVFTLALFVLVFAAASIVKIHAAGNVTGWLWGGSEDVSIGGVTGDSNVLCKTYLAPAGCIDGNETGIGWISMSGPTYGVSIPGSDGNVTGYAWMNAGGNPDNGLQNGIGSIDFNPQDNCGSAYSAVSCNAPDGSGADATRGGVKRVGDNLIGWARIVEIAKATVAPSNSGGWTGWIKFSVGGIYGSGIDVTKMDGTGDNKMYAWSGAEAPGLAGELGWIDFSRAQYTPPCTLKFVPAIKTMDENSSGTVTLEEDSLGANCNSGIVSFTNNPIVNSLSPISVDFFNPAKETETITLGIGAVSSETTYNNAVTASSASSGTASLTLIVRNIPVCVLDCPNEIVLSPDENKSVKSEIGITGETGCVSSAISCSESGTDANGNIGVSSGCDVSETGGLRYGSSELTAIGGTGSCTAPIRVKGPGWIETNP
ncbi:MAG: hypothetical protein V1814_02335 [Candidatus Moraniibacteriota bacterium]